MHRFKLFGLALVVVMAVGVGTASVASANNAETPEFSVAPNKIIKTEKMEGVLHFSVLGSALTVLCTGIENKAGGLNEVTTATHGKFAVLFTGCKSNLGTTCTGLQAMATAGTIAVSGEFLLRYKTITELVAFIKLEPTETHFECGLGTLANVKGTVCGPILPVNSVVEDFTVTLKSNGTKGDQAFTQVANGTNTANEACGLESSTNGGAFVMSSEEATTLLIPEIGAEIKQL